MEKHLIVVAGVRGSGNDVVCKQLASTGEFRGVDLSGASGYRQIRLKVINTVVEEDPRPVLFAPTKMVSTLLAHLTVPCRLITVSCSIQEIKKNLGLEGKYTLEVLDLSRDVERFKDLHKRAEFSGSRKEVEDYLKNNPYPPKSSFYRSFIYALEDPTTLKIRYVGKSDNPTMRLEQHLDDCGSTPKCKWIQELKAMGLSPNLRIVRETDSFYWKLHERQEILRLAPDLNATEGGDGISSPSKETREKLSLANKGKKHSLDTKIKMSESRKAWIAKHGFSEEYRKNLSASAGHAYTDEARSKMSESARKRGSNVAYEYSILCPLGNVIDCANLTEFCKDRLLQKSHLTQTLPGRRRVRHKGYRLLTMTRVR